MIEKVRNMLYCLQRDFDTAFEDLRFCNDIISQLVKKVSPEESSLIEEAQELQEKLREDWGQTINNVD